MGKNHNCITQRICIFIIPIYMNHFFLEAFFFYARHYFSPFFGCCLLLLWLNLHFQGAYNPMNYCLDSFRIFSVRQYENFSQSRWGGKKVFLCIMHITLNQYQSIQLDMNNGNLTKNLLFSILFYSFTAKSKCANI